MCKYTGVGKNLVLWTMGRSSVCLVVGITGSWVEESSSEG